VQPGTSIKHRMRTVSFSCIRPSFAKSHAPICAQKLFIGKFKALFLVIYIIHYQNRKIASIEIEETYSEWSHLRRRCLHDHRPRHVHGRAAKISTECDGFYQAPGSANWLNHSSNPTGFVYNNGSILPLFSLAKQCLFHKPLQTKGGHTCQCFS